MRVSDLTSESKNAFWPAFFTLIVVSVEYPIPALTITTSVIIESFVFVSIPITGFNLAPAPAPVESTTSRSGAEKYSWPPKSIFTSVILPFTTTAFKAAFLPFFKDMIGFLWLLIVSDPYPVPGS